VAGALFGLVIDRRREIALLRFFWAQRADKFAKLIVMEAGLIGLIANFAVSRWLHTFAHPNIRD